MVDALIDVLLIVVIGGAVMINVRVFLAAFGVNR
jgi:hypothetical protein